MAALSAPLWFNLASLLMPIGFNLMAELYLEKPADELVREAVLEGEVHSGPSRLRDPDGSRDIIPAEKGTGAVAVPRSFKL
jgi:hypothetical protein